MYNAADERSNRIGMPFVGRYFVEDVTTDLLGQGCTYGLEAVAIARATNLL